MALKQNILLCLFSSIALTVFAQENTTERLLWSNLHITKNLSHNFSAKVKVSYYSTMPIFSSRFIDVGTSYEPTKNFSLGAYYRFKGAFQTACQRFYVETSFKRLQIKPLGLSFSARYRIQHRVINTTDAEKVDSYQMRCRFSVKKKITTVLKAYSSIESFYSNQGKHTKYHYDRFRLDLGLNYNVPNTKHQLRFYYRYQADHKDETNILSMLNIGYRFNF